MILLSVVGARPNFIKISPFLREVEAYNRNGGQLQHILVHTGQHYDPAMSSSFFAELGIPAPDYNLGIGSGSHAGQVGNTMIAFEAVLLEEKPDWVIVVGDVNATLACSITAKKLGVRVCHIEAGIRSFDQRMPEEINRIVTDRLSDLLLTPDRIAGANLLSEGVPEAQIEFVGNIMIDTLMKEKPFAEALIPGQIICESAFDPDQAAKYDPSKQMALVTLHRPENVDDPAKLQTIVSWLIRKASNSVQLVWALHPRALNQLRQHDLLDACISTPGLILLNPLPYRSMLRLNLEARLVLTDSGGLPEEACVLGVPFMLLRQSTERPLTLAEQGGTGYLCGVSVQDLDQVWEKLMQPQTAHQIPPYWDGHTASRCLQALLKHSV